MSQPSLFTKIIRGEIPCHKVYEDADTLAFLDIHPVTEGHTLVVPKNEIEFAWDLPDDDYLAVMLTSKKVALRLREVLGAPYIGQKVEGVDVPHAHVHLIPFSAPEEFLRRADAAHEPDHAALAELAKRLAF